MYKILFYTVLFIGIVPILLLFYKKRALSKTHPVIPFVWLTALATIYEFVGSVLLQINTVYWFQIYSLLELLALYYFFNYLSGYFYSRIYQILFVFLVVFYVFSFVFWKETDKFIPLAINGVSTTFFVIVSVYLWFKNLFRKMEIMSLWKHDNFYFVSSFFIYYSVTFLLFILSKSIFIGSNYSYDYWLLNIIATFVLRILIIIGIWKMKTDLKSFSGQPV